MKIEIVADWELRSRGLKGLRRYRIEAWLCWVLASICLWIAIKAPKDSPSETICWILAMWIAVHAGTLLASTRCISKLLLPNGEVGGVER